MEPNRSEISRHLASIGSNQNEWNTRRKRPFHCRPEFIRRLHSINSNYNKLATQFQSELNWRLIKDLQIDGFVPVDDVTGDGEGFNVDHVDVAAFCAHVQIFALERQVEAKNPVTNSTIR